MKKIQKKLQLDQIRSLHGGYWRYPFLDFYYLSNPYFPPKRLLEILKNELSTLITHYPSTHKVIARLLSKWKKNDYFNEENLVVGNGSSELIRILNKIITKILVPVPIFNEFVRLPKEKTNLFFLNEEENFVLNIDKFIAAIKKSKCEFAVINNPNNPTGNLVTPKDIEKILKTGVITIVDESFIDFCPKYSVEKLVPKYKNLIILKGISKTMGLGGLRVGYLLTTNKKIKDLVKDFLPIWNINSVAERFIELFPKFKKEYKYLIKKTIQERDRVYQKLKEISYLKPFKPYANFIFCKTEISSRKIAETLFSKFNILIKYGLNQEFLKSDNYIRIGVRTRKENNKLILALNQIKKCGE